MRAVTWHGRHDMRMDNVPDPIIQHDKDIIVRITSTAICGHSHRELKRGAGSL